MTIEGVMKKLSNLNNTFLLHIDFFHILARACSLKTQN